MSAFTRDEIIAQLVAKNIPRHMAERAADAELAAVAVQHWPPRGAPSGTHPVAFTHSVRVLDEASDIPPAVFEAAARPPIAWPLRLTLPWSVLVSDNDREEPYIVNTANGPRPARRMTKRCKEAREKIQALARGKLAGAEAATIPLELFARVWIPGGSSRNDVANFGKATHDALEGIVYRNDNLLHDTRWKRVGVDVDAPRAEITITPLFP